MGCQQQGRRGFPRHVIRYSRHSDQPGIDSRRRAWKYQAEDGGFGRPLRAARFLPLSLPTLRCLPAKIYFLAKRAFGETYDDATLKKWLHTFFRRFFQQQFKRSCLPDGPKVGSVSLSHVVTGVCRATRWLRFGWMRSQGFNIRSRVWS